MKSIYAVMKMKNDSDIIESFCRYHAHIYDGMILCDDGSEDSTVQIAEKLIAEGINIILLHRSNWPRDINKPDTDFYNWMAETAFDQHGADIALCVNIDEFMCSLDGKNPREYLENLDESTLYKLRRYNAIYENEPTNSTRFLPEHFQLYLDGSHDYSGRVVLSRYLFKEQGGRVGLGVHNIEFPEGKAFPLVAECTPLCYAHYAVRGAMQYTLKIATGWLTFGMYKIEGAASHWKRAYELIKSSGVLTPQQTKELSYYMLVANNIENPITHEINAEVLYSFLKENKPLRKLPLRQNVSVILRAILPSNSKFPKKPNIVLSYTDYNEINKKYLGLILSHVEGLLSAI